MSTTISTVKHDKDGRKWEEQVIINGMIDKNNCITIQWGMKVHTTTTNSINSIDINDKTEQSNNNSIKVVKLQTPKGWRSRRVKICI